MQQYAVRFILLQNHSTCFGCPPHPSSGVLKTITPASGTGYNICTATPLQHPDLATLGGSSCTDDLYQRLWLQFLVLLMMGAVDIRNM